ncbi:cutl-6 [Pristionchus pacificus]|uniref:Cutl-6 n=1 Tax=Pristionchus pacificus TaxID=54126 RepID=A0A454XML8_PRIPA|nr:cutl-6 [Pristionchus pacificus]|eukprot:PDM69464.1 cutl-6 [Pristionchus pacificus]
MRSALILLATAAALSAEIISYADNAIVGTPKVVCEENDLALDIVTSKPFRGNIFVKGRAKDKSCRQSYANNGTNSYSLPLGKCGMQRLRSANPRGVNFVVTVIVSFHPAGFITKNDRAFHVRCFYMEPDEIVTSSIDVSGIPTTELADEMRMPSCEYSVRKDSLNGPALTFANVGETVYHVWECTGAEMGMLVKKCFVTDGDGEDHAVIDFDGYAISATVPRLPYIFRCTTDPFLLSQLTYDNNLMRAHATSQVFKYADSNQLYFTCQIRLCQKQMGLCADITPPKCGAELEEGLTIGSNRTRRSIRDDEEDRRFEVDVATRELLVLDSEETYSPSTVCLPKMILPTLPLLMVTLCLLSVLITMSCTRKTYRKNPFP